MLARIINRSISHKRSVLMATIAFSSAGIWAMFRTPVDAIPDLSDAQVIVMTDWPGQAPQLVEDQITDPLETALHKVPRIQFVRGMSRLGSSAGYVVFE